MSGRLTSRILAIAGRCRSKRVHMSTLPSARPSADDISASASARFDVIIGANPVQLVQLPTVNRALLASSEIKQGALIFSEVPILCARAPRHKGKVCDHCLRVYPTAFSPLQPYAETSASFCSADCMQTARSSYLPGDDASGEDPLQPLLDRCERLGERFPLLVARMACRLLNGDTTAAKSLQEIEVLSWVNVGVPPPQQWVDTYECLLSSLRRFIAVMPPGGDVRSRAERVLEQEITLGFFISMLSRLHINTFRVDAIFPIPAGQSLASMAAAVFSGASEGHSGSALYLLGSMFNHACAPNVTVLFPGSDNRVHFFAARDISPAEELCISYIAEGMPRADRQDQLAFAYGFECKCELCQEEAVNL